MLATAYCSVSGQHVVEVPQIRQSDPTRAHGGEYSRGANGLWIENGELTRPVQEVTVAGHLLEMLQGIDAVGNDLAFRGNTAAPTIRFRELTVSGE